MAFDPRDRNLEDLLLAEKVELMVPQGASGKADAADGGKSDKLVPIRDLKFERKVGEICTVKGPITTRKRNPLDAVLSFSFTATLDTFTWVYTRNARTHEVIPPYDWVFKATNSDGTSKPITKTGIMIRIVCSKHDGKANPVDVYCCIQMPDNDIGAM